MKRRLKSTSSLVSQGQGTSTDPSEEKKKILPGQKDEIKKTDSKSETCTESAGILKSDDSSIDALSQGYTPFIICKDLDLIEPRLHNIDLCSSDKASAHKTATTTATQTLDICLGKGDVKQHKLKEKEKKTASEMRQEPQVGSPGKYHGKKHEQNGRKKIETTGANTDVATIITRLQNLSAKLDHSKSKFCESSQFPSCGTSPSISSSVAEPSCQAGILNKWSTCADEMQKHTGSGFSSVQSETMSDGAGKLSGEKDKLPNYFSFSSQIKIPQQASSSRPSLTEPQNLCTKAPKMFTPDFIGDFDDETYRFQCSSPGLYQCEVTGLVFHMEGEGKVLYRTVPWNRKLLSQYHKKPAGPLFDIKCLQQSVCQLHLPHCEILSTGACNFLSVAHMTDEGIEFISPHKITETHVIINITGFSGFGNVKDEDSPPDPVKALILLFYKLPDDHDVRSLLNVLLVPRNIVIQDLRRTRRKLIGDEKYIDVSPYCKLQPKQTYSLSTDLGSEFVKVQPTEAEFDEESYNSYFTSFQVILKTKVEVINLKVENKSSSCCVWEREVCLFPSTVRAQNARPVDRLFEIRRSFIEGISGAVLQSLVDKLLQTKVITDPEREAAEERQSRRDKARYVIDTVRRKGDAASSKMIEFLCEADPFFCEHVGLTRREMQQ